jgi:hypothetical protein
MRKLLTGFDVDGFFRWPKGRAERLARRGKLPHFILPGGDIRFVPDDVAPMVRHVPPENPATLPEKPCECGGNAGASSALAGTAGPLETRQNDDRGPARPDRRATAANAPDALQTREGGAANA